MSYNFVTVTATYQDGAGNPATVGRYEWYPTAQVVDTTAHVEINAPVQVGQLDSTGSFSVSLLATDNEDLSAFYWVLTVWIGGQDGTAVTYSVEHANGATQSIDELTVIS